jgi:hypothetical protein
VCEELKGQAEAMAAEMRQKMKELSGVNEEKLEMMRKEMGALRSRSLEAHEEQQRMKVRKKTGLFGVWRFLLHNVSFGVMVVGKVE